MEIDDPRIHARIPTHATQDTPQTDHPYTYGTVTLCGIPFQRNFRLGWSVFPGGLSTPHVPCGIRFELCRFRSPLLTTSRLISLPPPTEMFQFGGFPIQIWIASFEAGCPIRESPDHRLLASTRSLSQLGTPFIGTRTEPSTDWLVSARHFNVSARTHLTSYVHTFTRPHGVFWTLGPSPVTHVSGCIGSGFHNKCVKPA